MSNEYINNKKFESIIEEFQSHKKEKRKFELILGDLEKSAELRKDPTNSTLLSYKAKFIEAASNYDKFQSDLAFAFHKLSQNIATYARFNTIDIDDAVQEGILICFDKIDKFDKNKGKAFNYMTTCILNHFRQIYRGNRNYNEFKKKYHDFLRDKSGSGKFFKDFDMEG